MSWPRLQAIDCDIHPSVPSMRALLPYLDDHWRETVEARGIASLESISYPRHAPLTAGISADRSPIYPSIHSAIDIMTAYELLGAD